MSQPVHEIVPDGIDLDTLRDRQSSVKKGERKACPNPDCTEKWVGHGSLSITKYAPGLSPNQERRGKWRCNFCGDVFDEPAIVEVGSE